MVVSILHRITGGALSVVGLAILVWWLMAIASGPEAYASFTHRVWGDLGQLNWDGLRAIAGSLVKVFLKVALFGLTWAFFQHLFSGIRHLIMDSGMGFELKANKAGAIATILGSIAASVLVWAYWLGAFE